MGLVFRRPPFAEMKIWGRGSPPARKTRSGATPDLHAACGGARGLVEENEHCFHKYAILYVLYKHILAQKKRRPRIADRRVQKPIC